MFQKIVNSKLSKILVLQTLCLDPHPDSTKRLVQSKCIRKMGG
jgi:hypothetical protein